MKHRQATPLLLLTLYGLLIAALLVLTLAGARCYAAAADSRQRHADARNALAFLQTQAASCGERIALRQGPAGLTLALPDGDTGYETRVYCEGGTLYTEYTQQDLPSAPGNAVALCAAADFSAAWRGEDLLEVTVDGRSACIWQPGGTDDGA